MHTTTHARTQARTHAVLRVVRITLKIIKQNSDIYSKLHLHPKSSALPLSDGKLRIHVHDNMLNKTGLLHLKAL